MIEDRLKQAVAEALEKLGISAPEVALEHPSELSHGDYSSNVALAAAKKAGVNPKELAGKIVVELGTVEDVSKIDVAGPGFINFHLSRDFFAESVKEISENKEWCWNKNLAGKKIIVEYSQPNPFKPFHIGHLMSTAIGESLSRLVEASGATVRRYNYHGDIGPHVAKALWGLMQKGGNPQNIADLGAAYVYGTACYEDDPAAKAAIDDINQRLYAADPTLKEVYEAGRATSLKHFSELYEILGSHFDRAVLESEATPIGLAAVQEALEKNILEKSDGAVVFKGEKYGLHTRVFVTSRNTPLYETKELGFVQIKRKEFPFDLNITDVGQEQDSYFTVLEKVVDLLWPEIAGRYRHVFHGMMQFSGGKMSSRKGNVITGESLIEDMRAKALEKMEGRELGEEKQDIADAVAVAAIKYSILKQATGKNIIFDPEASLSFEGDSGPYLQYAHVRARAVLRKAEEENVPASVDAETPEEVSELERLLYRFPQIIERAQKENEPHHVTTFLTEIAAAFNSWYAQGKIVDSGDDTSPYKVALTEAFATTMKNGLWLLGIQAPERM